MEMTIAKRKKRRAGEAEGCWCWNVRVRGRKTERNEENFRILWKIISGEYFGEIANKSTYRNTPFLIKWHIKTLELKRKRCSK